MGNGVNDVMHWKCAEDLGNLKKVSRVETRHQTRRVDFRLLAEALGRCRTRWGDRWKSQNRKIVPLSPYVEKPLNSKVIKSFLPELRSRKCFSCFEIRMFYIIYIWTLYILFTHNCIWLWYILSVFFLVTVISFSLFFFMDSLSWYIDVSLLSSVLVRSFPPPFLGS